MLCRFPPEEPLKVKHRIFDASPPYGTANREPSTRLTGARQNGTARFPFSRKNPSPAPPRKKMSNGISLQGCFLGCFAGDCKLVGDNIRRRYCRRDVGSAQ